MILDDQTFAAMVWAAYEEMPPRFKDELENLEILIEATPNPTQMNNANAKGCLLGLFEGVPKTAWGQATMGVQPSKITLFREPILTMCANNGQLKNKIKEVLMHEIAHYFGYNEQEVRALDSKFRKKTGQSQ